MNETNKARYMAFLNALTEAFGCEPLIPEEDDERTMIGLDNDMGMIFEVAENDESDDPDDDEAVLMATVYIGGLPDHPEEILMDAMKDNYYLAGTEGAILALDPQSHALTAFRSIPLETPPDEVPLIIGKLVGLSREWNKRLKHGEPVVMNAVNFIRV